VVEKDALKSLSDSIAELKTELVSVKSAIDEMQKKADVEKLDAEVKSLTKELVEVKAKLKTPVFKAVDTSSVSERKAEETAKVTGRGVLGLI
jgi:uncharacterized coiled-coil DUF342 family protein